MKKNKNRARQRRETKRLAKLAPTELAFECQAEFENLEAAEGEAKIPGFKMIAYTGGKMRPRWMYGEVVVDLKGVEFASETLPILRNHNQDRVVGHGAVKKWGGSIRVEGQISGVGEDAEEIIATAKRGFPWQASMGARVGKVHFLAEQQSMKVNGQTFEGPLYIAQQTQIRELSFVASGADANTSVKVAAASYTGDESMTFEQWLKATFCLDAAALTDEQRQKFEAQWKLEAESHADDDSDDGASGDDSGSGGAAGGAPAPLAAQTPADDQSRKEAAQELRRQAQIRKRAGTDHVELAATAIEENWSFERFETDILKAELKAIREERPQGAPAIHDGADGRDDALAIECSLALGHGLSAEAAEKQKLYPEATLERAGARDMRGYSLHRLMHNVLRAAGKSHPVGQNDDEFIRKTFQANRELEASGFSTVSLPGILSNVANKVMLASYQMYPSVIPFFCRIASAQDFKPFYSYRLEGDGLLQKLGADGQIKHASLTEQQFMNRVSTYARMLGLTREMLINDDLGALGQTSAKLGEMSFKAHELAGIELLLSPPQYLGNDFFSVAHGNLLTGAGSELSIDALTAADVLFGDQTATDGYPISVNAERLLVPRALNITASQLMNDTRIELTGSTDLKLTESNPHAGAYEYRSTPWLSNATVTGASATVWVLFANPASLAAFEVAYLRGAQTPTIESADTDFNTLGMQQRAYFDFGFGAGDPVGAVRSDGA
jgi:hypothetical protein